MYPEWLANILLMKKVNKRWKVCIDFTDLNKAYLKDSYPLPYINQLVYAITRHELLSFLDMYLRYHQILMADEDREKSSFIIDQETYCYTIILFGLKNARASFQRLVNKFFSVKIVRNVETYVDDIIVKSKKLDYHVKNLNKSFDILRRYNIKLNLEKCVFGISTEKVLEFMVSQKGIKVNLNAIQFILDMHPPKIVKEMQKLTGQIVALN